MRLFEPERSSSTRSPRDRIRRKHRPQPMRSKRTSNDSPISRSVGRATYAGWVRGRVRSGPSRERARRAIPGRDERVLSRRTLSLTARPRGRLAQSRGRKRARFIRAIRPPIVRPEPNNRKRARIARANSPVVPSLVLRAGEVPIAVPLGSVPKRLDRTRFSMEGGHRRRGTPSGCSWRRPPSARVRLRAARAVWDPVIRAPRRGLAVCSSCRTAR